ncbi:MAG: SMP-30/gluconolactonase/LRE family protein [Gammaproteobacteria bacterium]
MKKPLVLVVSAVFTLFLAYLLLWPTGMDPVSWTPPKAPELAGVYAPNDKLKAITRFAEGVGRGPEAVVVDADRNVYTGYHDGRVMMFSPNGAVLASIQTGGRPLGLTLFEGKLIVADARRGLLSYDGKELSVLATEADGMPFGFTDDVDVARNSRKAYFTDASHKFGYGKHMIDLLEHGANGRLLEYDFDTQQVRVLMNDLHFANGVAVGPDDAYLLVNETAEYRVLRYWLKGGKAGTHEVFIDNLPGFPDNITFNGRDAFWLAIFAPRDALLDRMLPGHGYVRTIVAKLPKFLQPQPKKHSFALGLDVGGKVSANLQYAGSDAYAPITSVREHDGELYFGSLTYPAIGRMAVAEALKRP